MLVCKHVGIEYDIDHWAFITWLETAKSLRVDIGDVEKIKDSIMIVSRQRETLALLDRVMTMQSLPKRSRKARKK